MSDNGGQSWEELMRTVNEGRSEVGAPDPIPALDAHADAIMALVEAGRSTNIALEGIRQALGSLIDVVDELCSGLAWGQTPDQPWAEQVSATLSEHRQKLGFNPTEPH